MTEPTEPTTSGKIYNLTGDNCPRCNQPLKVQTSATGRKVYHIKCIRCAFILDVDRIQKHVSSIVSVIAGEEPEDAPESNNSD